MSAENKKSKNTETETKKQKKSKGSTSVAKTSDTKKKKSNKVNSDNSKTKTENDKKTSSDKNKTDKVSSTSKTKNKVSVKNSKPAAVKKHEIMVAAKNKKKEEEKQKLEEKKKNSVAEDAKETNSHNKEMASVVASSSNQSTSTKKDEDSSASNPKASAVTGSSNNDLINKTTDIKETIKQPEKQNDVVNEPAGTFTETENLTDKTSLEGDNFVETSEPKQKEEYTPKHTVEAIDKKTAVLEKHNARMDEREEKKRKKEHNKKVAKVISIVLASVAAVYIIGVLVFSFVTYPRTYVADTDVSLKTDTQLKDVLNHNSNNYTLHAEGDDVEFDIKGSDIDYVFDADQVFIKMKANKNAFTWPVDLFLDHSFKDNYVVSFSPSKVEEIVSPIIDSHNLTSIKPVNAGFNVNTLTKTATVKNEVIGNTLDSNKTLESVKNCIGNASQHLELNDEQLVLPNVYANNSKMDGALNQANVMLQTTMTLIMDTLPISTITATDFGTWLEVDPSYTTILNQAQLGAWVASLANTYDTLGKTRTFVTPYGKSVTVNTSLGWEIDQEGLMSEINTKINAGKETSVAVPCSSSIGTYAGPNGKDWGNRYIDVDLAEQMVRMYDEAGSLIFSAACVSGKPETPTPTGMYTVYSKESPSILVADDGSYRTPVSYWMPFSGGCGFHDATWQSSFGGNRWMTGFGSHGCVNLSLGDAGTLYQLCHTGDIVISHF